MPKSKMKEEDEYRLPEDVFFPVILEEVGVKTINYVRDGQKKSFDKWEWTFKITDGDYAGMKVYGETEDNLNTRDDNLVRQWSEVLRGGVAFEIGEDFDTDDLIGLPAVVTVKHEEPREKRDGGFFYGCPIKDVFPEGTQADYS